MSRLTIDVAPGQVTLAGRIDDTAALGPIAERVAPGPLVLDTGGVTFINSVGVREWIRLLRALRERGVEVVHQHVADVLMTQMNLIRELAGERIASFHAQYVCPACGAEPAPLVDVATHLDALRRLEPPRLPCPECGAAMELGDFAEKYLSVFR
jgi:anti-anti-sigma regulatory factor